MNHRWTETGDLGAFYVYRFGHQALGRTRGAVARALDLDPGSVRMRIQNFQAIDGSGGLGHFAKQSVRIYERHRTASEPELRALVLAAMQRRRS